MKKILISLLIMHQSMCMATPSNEKMQVCQIQETNVSIYKEQERIRFLGSAVYEADVFIAGKKVSARFDCKPSKENISFNGKDWYIVDPKSCAAALHREICGI